MEFEKIKKKLEKHKTSLYSNYSIKRLGIFGSKDKKDVKGGKELDILVEFKQPIGIRFIDLADDLERLLDSKVDLISRQGIDDKYLKFIRKDLVYV